MPAPANTSTHAFSTTATTPPSRCPTLSCDWEEWSDYLAEVDAPDDCKRQMIETLWAIVVEFHDLRWDIVDGKSCGQDLDLKSALEAAVLNSEAHQIEEEV